MEYHANLHEERLRILSADGLFGDTFELFQERTTGLTRLCRHARE